jgi:multisubunit Na+/H+ antiporter MnhB subunit
VEVLALVILIRATISRDKSSAGGEKYLFGAAIAAVLLLAVFMCGLKLLDSMPEFGTAIFEIAENSASKTYIARGLEKTGAPNIVASVILDFRAYDTLGEATVLFTSIIGATVILRKKSKKALEDAD